MNCPRDDASLSTSQYEAHIEIDTCSVCRGVWLDSGELQKIQETVERDYTDAHKRDDIAEAIDAAKQNQRGPIKCPKCEGAMTARAYGMGSAIVIDVCDAGCGVWLDAGELQALEKFFEDSRNDTSIPFHWRLWASVVSVFHRK